MEDRGCCHSKSLFCQQPPLILHYQEIENLYAKLEELICGHHVFMCKTFSFFSHESTATGFLDCSSVGPLGSSLLHIAKVPLSAFGVSLIGST